MLTLDDLGKNLNLTQSSDKNNYLAKYEREISSRWSGRCKILIISNDNPNELSLAFAKRFPHASITTLTYKKDIRVINPAKNLSIFAFPSINELVTWCKNIAQVDVIIEHSANYKSHKIQLFKELFFLLSEKGLYFIEEIHAKYIDKLADCEGDDILDILQKIYTNKIAPTQFTSQLDNTFKSIALHTECFSIIDKLAIVEKRGVTFRGLRTSEANDLVKKSILPGVKIFESSVPSNFKTSNVSTGNIEHLLKNRHKKSFEIPETYLNRYAFATCIPGQIVYIDNFLLPDTFRMQHHKALSNKNINSLSNYFYSLKSTPKPEFISGEFLYLDSEFPGHFGHFTSEVVSRLWAWKKLKTQVPNLKVLLSTEKGKKTPAYAIKILNSFGIKDADIQTFSNAIEVESLYTASPYYVIAGHIHPEITDIWSDINKGVSGGKSQISGDRLFIARPVNGGRKCLNPEHLETMFSDAGFEFFSPENYSWEDQIKTFSQAKHIAGYSGSGFFNSMFCEKTSSIISIGSDSYNAVNEHLICAARNVDLHYIWADSTIKHGNYWSVKAFMSDYEFNYERDEKHLADILKKLD